MQIRLIGLVLLAGCKLAGSPAPSTMATVRDEAHVCIDANSGAALNVGASVRFIHSTCQPLNAKSAIVRCTPSTIGDGEIVRVDQSGCGEVRVRTGAAPVPGDRVELVSSR